jgi:hypothetical protein
MRILSRQMGHWSLSTPSQIWLLLQHLDYGLGGPGSNPGRCNDFGTFPGVKRPETDVDHSHPSSAEVKNEWSIPLLSPTCLHGVVRNSLCSTILLYNKRGSAKNAISRKTG